MPDFEQNDFDSHKTELIYPIIGTEVFKPVAGDLYTPDAEDFRLNHVLKLLRLKMKSNFAPYLDFYDVIEIYNVSGKQIYSNGLFFEVTSVPLELVRTRTFEELYSRSSDIVQTITEHWINLLTNSAGKVLNLEKIPTHTLREIGGEKRLIQVKFKYGTTLFDDEGNIAGIIVTQDAIQVTSPILRTI